MTNHEIAQPDPMRTPTSVLLDRAGLDPDPIGQFRAWHAEVAAAGMREPSAMTLATADVSGDPSARVVLLRGVDERGFAWHTSRTSLKGRDLAKNPRGALVFHWDVLERQVRVAGPVVQLSDAESADYFATRSRLSQLSAWASEQGQPLSSRATLEAEIERLGWKYPGEVPLPPFWGGYRLRPEWIEFWQGRRDRMHDRFVYLRQGPRWQIERLAP